MSNLGTVETFEVWLLPENREAYLPRALTGGLKSLEDAREYIVKNASKYAGEIEVVRETTTRQRMA